MTGRTALANAFSLVMLKLLKAAIFAFVVLWVIGS